MNYLFSTDIRMIWVFFRQYQCLLAIHVCLIYSRHITYTCVSDIFQTRNDTCVFDIFQTHYDIDICCFFLVDTIRASLRHMWYTKWHGSRGEPEGDISVGGQPQSGDYLHTECCWVHRGWGRKSPTSSYTDNPQHWYETSTVNIIV